MHTSPRGRPCLAPLAALMAWSFWAGTAAHAQGIRVQPPPAAPAPPAPVATPAPAAPPPASPPPPPLAAEAAPAGPQLSLMQAIHTTLRRHPAIFQAYATTAHREAELNAARAPFDPSLSAQLGHNRDNSPLLPNERIAPAERSAITDTTDLNVGLGSTFQWGMNVAPSLSLERLRQRHDPNAAMLPTAPAERARASLAITQPLMRGFGTIGTASNLRAAEHLRDSAEHNAAYTAQAQVFATIVAYYKLIAAQLDLARYRESQARAQQLLAETKLLVEAENRPRADLRQIEASLATQTRGYLEAEANVLAAEYALGLAMGLDGREAPPDALADGLPEVQVPAASPGALVDAALHARRDLFASEAGLAGANAALEGAEWNTLPQLDLGLSLGYAGAVQSGGADTFFTSAGRNIPGLNGGATLTLQLPIANTAQRAERDQRRAERWSAELGRDDVARQIRTQVRSALDELRLAAAALEAATQAVALLELAVTDERDKLREGLSTVIDVVLTEERLTQAQLLMNSDHLRYAIAIASLQFEQGALPSSEAEVPGSQSALLTAEAAHARR